MNRIAAEWDKRTRELKKQEMQRKQEARDRGEDVSSDDDDNDDDGNDDEVAGDMDWDVLEDEGTLTSAHPSMQGPLPFRVEGSESARSAELDRTSDPSSGPVGAGESAASCGVPAEDWWVAGSKEAPEVLMEEGGLLLCLVRGQR